MTDEETPQVLRFRRPGWLYLARFVDGDTVAVIESGGGVCHKMEFSIQQFQELLLTAEGFGTSAIDIWHQWEERAEEWEREHD